MEVFEYRLPLVRPLPLVGGEVLTERRGVLLHDPETGGWGDAAPLPGFSQETVEEVLETARSGTDASDLPSLRFAMSCMLQGWKPSEDPVKVNALWIPGSESVSELVKRIGDWERPVVKVKPGLEPDVMCLKAVCEQIPGIQLRIDGNRQWTLEQVLKVVKAVPEDHLEYLEEPLASGEGYEALWDREPVPIALDEHLLEPGGEALAGHSQVAAYVLKPTLLGSVWEVGVWVKKARELDKNVVWSSCFESGVGIWHVAQWAAGGVAAGLDPAGWLARDVVSPRPLAEKGEIRLPEKLLINPPFLPTET